MPLKSNDGRKYSDVNLSANSRSTSEYNETKLAARSMIDIHQQQVNPARKPNLAVPKITHHKLDSDKAAQAAVHEKVERLDPCVYESTEFAGVTIVFRAASNPKLLGHTDAHGKRARSESRRKSESHQSNLQVQHQLEHGVRADLAGDGYELASAKSEGSIHHFHGTSGDDHQH